MVTKEKSLTTGSPQFKDKRLAGIMENFGAQAAWREAISQSISCAAEGVSGDFSVGLQEPSGRTFLAVDRFSIRTLCYCLENGQLRFASRADELAASNAEIDQQAIFDYLYFHVIPSPRTIYKGIFRLPPGHYAIFENGKLTVAPYWQATFEVPPSTSFNALRDEFLQVLHDSVATQLNEQKPACFLSGGTDSSTVAGMASLASGRTVSTYSIGFEVQGYDEMEYARIASQHFKTDHHEYYVTPNDLMNSIQSVAAHFDQPFGNSSALPAYFCAKMAREDGAEKLLAGDGGDELFGGNSRYAKQKLFGIYDHLPGVFQTRLIEPLLLTRTAKAIPFMRKMASYVEQARASMPDRLEMYNLIMRLGVENVLTPQLLGNINISTPLNLARDVWKSTANDSPLNQELSFDWRFTLAESDIPKVMGATDLAGIGVGFPLLDDRLLNFSLKLSPQYKLKGLQLRWFFKEALRGFLPNAILTKKKQGFGLPFGAWLFTHPPLKAFATDSLNSLAERGVVRADFVQKLLIHLLPEHPAYYGEMVWILMMLEQWLVAKAPQFKIAD